MPVLTGLQFEMTVPITVGFHMLGELCASFRGCYKDNAKWLKTHRLVGLAGAFCAGVIGLRSFSERLELRKGFGNRRQHTGATVPDPVSTLSSSLRNRGSHAQ